MKKKVLSFFLVLTLLVGALPVSALASFSDITDADTALAAATLESMGIVNGTSPGTYSPNTKLTRAQFCTLAVRMMGLQDDAAAQGYKMLFSDVKPGFWYTGYVNLAYAKGIINGYGNGKFGPEDEVTYGQAATITLRLLGYTAGDIGKLWPADYVAFAENLDLAQGLSLDANSRVTRGQAAILLYNTLGTNLKGNKQDYYETMGDTATTAAAIVLDTDASHGSETGLLMACAVGASTASVQYYKQEIKVSSDLAGRLGTLLMNSSGETVGFMPSGNKIADVTVDEAKSSGITSVTGETYRVAGGAKVIINGSVYAYGSSGYLQVDGQKGKSVRLFYDDDGAVGYVYISSGTSLGGTGAIVAATVSAGSELARRLGISGMSYAVTKNGGTATLEDIAQNDVGYYDAATRTMRVSDYRIGGYIEAASPSASAATTVTVAGCTLDVLESAWDTLSGFTLGSSVTLLLTDDGKVAAAVSAAMLSADMIGILSPDGSRVTLSGSGLVLTADTVTAASSLRGTLVKVAASAKTELKCSAYTAMDPAKADLAKMTVGSYDIAPGCAIYEWAGSGYAYSLEGKLGISSSDFDEITWTKTLASSYVSWYHLNTAGEVDVLLLKNVTGNGYEYGKITIYEDEAGINLGTAAVPAWNTAATMTNSVTPAESAKYLFTGSAYAGTYAGIVRGASSADPYLRVAAVSVLTSLPQSDAGAFFQSDDKWYVTADGREVPVSGTVEVYVESVEKWLGGEEGLLTAVSSDMPLTLYYDRTLTTGGQIRVIVIKAQ